MSGTVQTAEVMGSLGAFMARLDRRLSSVAAAAPAGGGRAWDLRKAPHTIRTLHARHGTAAQR